MKYFVAYTITGPARDWHIQTSTALAEEFDLTPVYPRIPPHVTLKAPFEMDTIEPVREVLDEVSQRATRTPITMTGIDGFNEKVLFAGVYFSKEGRKVIEDLRGRLRDIPDLTFAPNDNSTRFHATLCRIQPPASYENARAAAESRAETFDLVFDHIALLHKLHKRWEVLEEYGW